MTDFVSNQILAPFQVQMTEFPTVDFVCQEQISFLVL